MSINLFTVFSRVTRVVLSVKTHCLQDMVLSKSNSLLSKIVIDFDDDSVLLGHSVHKRNILNPHSNMDYLDLYV